MESFSSLLAVLSVQERHRALIAANTRIDQEQKDARKEQSRVYPSSLLAAHADLFRGAGCSFPTNGGAIVPGCPKQPQAVIGPASGALFPV